MKLQWIRDILGDAYTEEMDAKVSAAGSRNNTAVRAILADFPTGHGKSAS